MCHDALVYGECDGSLVCFDDPDACNCIPDDGRGRGVCMPEGSVASQPCSERTGGSSCVAAGCTGMASVRALPQSGESVCEPP